MKKYRAAIVGCGRIASLFAEDKKRKGIVTHAQAYLADPRTDLVAACDLDPGRLASFGRTWGVQKLYTDIDEMLAKEKIDLLSICTWNASHAPLVESALKRGVSGIVCEKPVADTLANADRMIRSCAAKKVPLLINYTRRYVGLYSRIRSMIDRGELGKIQAVSCYYTAGIVNTGTHLFDFLRYFFGEASWVWADPAGNPGGRDKDLSGHIHFKKGFGCSLTALDVNSFLIFEADIYGTKKRVRLTDSGQRATVWEAAPHPTFSGYRALKEVKTLKGDLGEGMSGLIDDLVTAVEKGRGPVCSGTDGRAALEIAAAFHLSAEAGGRIIKLPIKNRHLQLISK